MLNISSRGALWMVLASLLFACMGVFVKIGSRYFTPAELVFYRAFVGLLVVWAIIAARGHPLGTPNWRLHLNRSVAGFSALALYFVTITRLPLPTAVTLNYTSSLFIAPLLVLLYRERPPLPLLLALALGFAGVVLLLRPTLAHDQLIDGLVGLASGFLAAIAMLNVKSLGQSGEPEWRVVFYFSLFSTFASGAWMLLHRFSPVDWAGAGILLGMGGSATLAQLALTRAYATGATLVVASLAYSTVVFSTLAGWLLWQHVPPLSAWLGMLLVMLAGVLATLLTARRK